MNAVDFLKKELQVIAAKFPAVQFKYGYNNIIETHVVELLPLYEFANNRELDKAWIRLSLEFMKSFKDEEVAFVSSDSSLSIQNVIFEFNIPICSEENIITEFYAAYTEEMFSYSFPTGIPDGRILGSNIIAVLSSPIEKISDIKYSETSYLAAA